MKYFPDEYRAHIEGKTCPAHVCTSFIKGYQINTNLCKGCGICVKKCSAEAIHLSEPTEGNSGKATIDAARCIKCGQCLNECAFGAVMEEW
jgi:ferredoxin